MADPNDLTRHISSFGGVQLAVVFGSSASGQAGPRSDVDIGVRLEISGCASAGSDRAMFQQIEIAIGKAVGRPVDLIDLDTAPPLLRFEIARTGVVLLERVPHAWADFLARAMIEWWDWGPTARSLHAAVARRLRRQVMHGSA